MTETKQADTARIHRVLAMTLGVVQTQALRAAAELEIADLLAEEALSVSALAEKTNTSPQGLRQLMRVLTHFGLMEETAPDVFRCTADGALLRKDATHSLRHYAILMGQDFFGLCWPEMLHSVRTGESTFEHTVGTGIYDFFRENQNASDVMHQAMSELSTQEGRAVCEAYDFSPFSSIVDLGGGRGGLLAAILKAYPQAKGTLFDLPHVVAEAGPTLKAADVADRCRTVGGDFREGIPDGGDLYILKRILLDATEESALAVLRKVRAAMNDGGRLLIAEPDVATSYGKRLDIFMLMTFGGAVRSQSEFETLFEKAGFTISRTFSTASAIRLSEALPR